MSQQLLKVVLSLALAGPLRRPPHRRGRGRGSRLDLGFFALGVSSMGLTLESAGSESELDSGALERFFFSAAGAGGNKGVVLSLSSSSSSSEEEEASSSSSSSDEEAAGGSSKWEESFGAMDGDRIHGF
ncbi:hypothetical protein PanWU01x14_342040 [Parasponia andersonii]|uniref:Uncharacterized protein n=1 Tax=Parasponia andersonii TaxID=3476 RepID=A0A2P5ADZ7_PARAD|nr:hypothetical protein PanWU01x14_342040 [Parasponia andersonii]